METLLRRPRRNRKSHAIRALTQEHRLTPDMFIAPLFVKEGTNEREEIPSMPDVYRLSIDELIKEAKELLSLGVHTINLFTLVPEEKKDAIGSEATNENNLLQRAVRALKSTLPELYVFVDIALDPFTDHGHDGLINNNGEVLNDPTLEVLGAMSLLAAEAGADGIAPSDMMDGRVLYLRRLLDAAGHTEVSILAYAAKYASSFYGPFRDALNSQPRFGDKKSYQLNPANSREALLECDLDEAEGADLLLIKPALAYLDIIAKVKESTYLPLGGYHVSGEYAMVMAAAEKGWLDADAVLHECLLAMKRAGCDFILTYAAKRIAQQLKTN